MKQRDAEIELAYCHDWFKAALDGADGVDWMNGDSDKYVGDAWTEARKIYKRLKKLLDR